MATGDVGSGRILRSSLMAAAALAVAGCAASGTRLASVPTRNVGGLPARTAGEARSVRVARAHGLRTVHVRHATPASFDGFASYYRATHVASGRYPANGLTAAHRSLPFGTRVRVRDPKTGRSVVVVINDRGPFVHGRVLDLSLGAARALGIEGQGVKRVHADVL